MAIGNAWLSIEQAILDEYRAYRDALESGEPYDGPMDAQSYEIMTRTKSDAEAVERLFNPVNVNDKTYKLFSFYSEGAQQTKQDIDYLIETWDDITAIGSWWFDTGIQGGQHPEYDDDGNLIGLTGTPFYPIPNNAWMFMPDTVIYDEDGNEIDRIPASSNDDLKDMNLLLGQVPRMFEDTLAPAVNVSGNAITLPYVYWPGGYGVRLELSVRDPDGQLDVGHAQWMANSSMSAGDVLHALAALVDAQPHWRAEVIDNRIETSLASDDYTGEITAELIQ